jgi:hypothetical protein
MIIYLNIFTEQVKYTLIMYTIHVFHIIHIFIKNET